MPHPKNRLKLTGDTHLPDVGLDLNLDDDEPMEMLEAQDARFYADGYVPDAGAEMSQAPEAMDHPEPPTAVQKVEQKVAGQTRSTPLLMAGAGLLFGWMVMRLLRR
jgi:hypothetical protein